MIGAIVFITLCAVAILIIRKRNKNAKLNPQIFKVELPVEERQWLPASAELPGLTYKHDRHAELSNSGIIELSNRERSELP